MMKFKLSPSVINGCHKTTYILIAIVLILFSCSSRPKQASASPVLNYIPYYLKVHEADSLFIVQEYTKSHKILDSLFQHYEPIDMEEYYEVATFYKLKIVLKKKIRLEDFSELISRYGKSNEYLKNDSILSIYYRHNDQYLDDKYDSLTKVYVNSVDVALRKEIRHMLDQDQLYRKSDYRKNIALQNEIDSVNNVHLMRIFTTKGYPGAKLLGTTLVDGQHVRVSTLLLHTKDSIRQNFYMPQVLKYVQIGTASPMDYALMRDQYNLYHQQEQYYGTYKNNIETPLPVINRRRLEIGLPPHGYTEWRLKKLYPKSYEHIKGLMNKNSR